MNLLRCFQVAKIERLFFPSQHLAHFFSSFFFIRLINWKWIFYADQLNITPNYLNILSQRYLKIPAGDVIKERTILEAKRLLISTDLSVKEIAYQLGFSDNGYFAKVFKKYIGITPTDFKENYNLYHSYH